MLPRRPPYRIASLPALGVAVIAIFAHTTSSFSTTARGAGSASAASSWIAFQRDSDLWLVRPSGSKPRLVARGASDPAWSPDGRQLAFSRREGSEAGLYVVDVDGGGERRLRRERAGTTPVVMSWSPNGRMIAFYRQFSRPGICGPLQRAGDFYVVNTDGSSVRRLTRHGQAHYASATWSPDSKRIAIVSCHDRGGDPEIYVIEADGSGERRLTRRPGWDFVAGWSRDGRDLLASGEERGGPADLYLMSADGRGRRNLTRSPTEHEGDARWSPDERRIVFVRIVGPGRIYVMNADGTHVLDMRVSTVPDFAPTWSPDGRQLAFSGNLSPWQVHVMNADGTKRRNLTPGGGIFPIWSPAWR
jgi:Tol biopolymer transport system component